MQLPKQKNCRVDYIQCNNILFSFLADFTNNDNIIYSESGRKTLKELYSNFKYRAENMSFDFYVPQNKNFQKIEGLNYKM